MEVYVCLSNTSHKHNIGMHFNVCFSINWLSDCIARELCHFLSTAKYPQHAHDFPYQSYCLSPSNDLCFAIQQSPTRICSPRSNLSCFLICSRARKLNSFIFVSSWWAKVGLKCFMLCFCCWLLHWAAQYHTSLSFKLGLEGTKASHALPQFAIAFIFD